MPQTQNILNRAIGDIKELRVFAAVCKDAIQANTDAVQHIDLLREAHEALRHPDPFPTEQHVARAKEHAQQVQDFARREAPAGFPYLHGLAAIRIWGILEVAVDDIAADILVDPARWPTFHVVAQIKGPLVEFAASTKEQQAEYLADQLKAATQARLKLGVGRFESVLDALGLGGPVDADVRRTLLELSEVRNLIAHRGWEVDRQFTTRCPWLKLTLGDRIIISESHFDLYFLAATWYVLELDRRFRIHRDASDERLPWIMELLDGYREKLLSLSSTRPDGI